MVRFFLFGYWYKKNIAKDMKNSITFTIFVYRTIQPMCKYMSNLIDFSFENQPIRVVIIDGKPWFVAKDVCNVLETDTSNVPRIVDEDEKVLYSIQTPGGAQKVLLVNEGGFYALVFRSKKAEAKAFSKWVRNDLLPAVRTGTYNNQNRVPLHIMRYIENENMLPHKHFSMLTEMIRQFYGKLAAMGAPESELEKLYADVSMGRRFNDFLRKHNIDTDSLPTYNHKTPWGKVVLAKAYPLRYLEPFVEYLHNEWIPNRSQKYIAERTPALLEYLPKLLK